MNQSTSYSCLRGRPKVDRLCDVRGLDAFASCQVRDRPRQIQHPMTLAPALRTFGVALQVPVYAARSAHLPNTCVPSTF